MFTAVVTSSDLVPDVSYIYIVFRMNKEIKFEFVFILYKSVN